MLPLVERPKFREGMRLHAEGDYYEAHEAWEELWHEEADDTQRLFLQGLIQITSAFHKVFHQKMPQSAGRLLARGLEKIEALPDDYLGLALGAFREGARAWLPRLAKETDFDRKHVPVLRAGP